MSSSFNYGSNRSLFVAPIIVPYIIFPTFEGEKLIDQRYYDLGGCWRTGVT